MHPAPAGDKYCSPKFTAKYLQGSPLQTRSPLPPCSPLPLPSLSHPFTLTHAPPTSTHFIHCPRSLSLPHVLSFPLSTTSTLHAPHPYKFHSPFPLLLPCPSPSVPLIHTNFPPHPHSKPPSPISPRTPGPFPLYSTFPVHRRPCPVHAPLVHSPPSFSLPGCQNPQSSPLRLSSSRASPSLPRLPPVTPLSSLSSPRHASTSPPPPLLSPSMPLVMASLVPD